MKKKLLLSLFAIAGGFLLNPTSANAEINVVVGSPKVVVPIGTPNAGVVVECGLIGLPPCSTNVYFSGPRYIGPSYYYYDTWYPYRAHHHRAPPPPPHYYGPGPRPHHGPGFGPGPRPHHGPGFGPGPRPHHGPGFGPGPRPHHGPSGHGGHRR